MRKKFKMKIFLANKGRDSIEDVSSTIGIVAEQQ